jgi:hypothetical protein
MHRSRDVSVPFLQLEDQPIYIAFIDSMIIMAVRVEDVPTALQSQHRPRDTSGS